MVIRTHKFRCGWKWKACCASVGSVAAFVSFSELRAMSRKATAFSEVSKPIHTARWTLRWLLQGKRVRQGKVRRTLRSRSCSLQPLRSCPAMGTPGSCIRLELRHSQTRYELVEERPFWAPSDSLAKRKPIDLNPISARPPKTVNSIGVLMKSGGAEITAAYAATTCGLRDSEYATVMIYIRRIIQSPCLGGPHCCPLSPWQYDIEMPE